VARAESIYTKDIASISFDDVQNFYNLRIREGLRIDYKRDFPSELERIVASFANTAGGVILIGVDEDSTNKPSSLLGIDLVKGLEERVLNICHSNSNPPITPEVAVCPFSSIGTTNQDKCVVFVRVPESGQAPHYIGKRSNLIYVRIDNESEQADAAATKSLMEKRDRGTKLSKELLDSKTIKSQNIPGFPAMRTTQVAAIPSCITKDIIDFNSETDRFLREHPRELVFGDERPKQRGIEFSGRSSQGDIERLDYCEVTGEGLIRYSEALTAKKPQIHYPRIIMVIVRVLEYSLGIYKKFGFNGGLTIRVELDNVEGCEFIGHPLEPVRWNISRDAYIVVERYVTMDVLAEDVRRPAVDIFMELARAFRRSLSKHEATEIVDACSR
jgi:hypothetical protein